MNAQEAKMRVKSLAGKYSTSLEPPTKLQRQKNIPIITDQDDDDVIDVEKGFVNSDENSADESTDAPLPLPKEPSAMSTFTMFVQANIMGSSTNMSALNGQLQKLQQEVLEKQNQMNELRSRMLNTQGSISMLHSISAKMKELNMVEESVENHPRA